ncbi:hypothetical protein ACLM5H_00025 [Fredinandcohnia humi]
MARYISYVLLVLAVEVGILYGISLYFQTDLLTTMFLGSCLFIFFAFLTGSSGDVFTKNSELAVFNTLLGSYKPRHEKVTLRIGPFMVGSLLTMVVYFAMVYFM